MAIFAKGIPRPAALLLAVAAFVIIPPEILARGPGLCLWRQWFHLAACPGCGSTRALAAFFHGRFAQALAFNRNVAITAPLIVALLGSDVVRLVRHTRRPRSLARAGAENPVETLK
jgi:hypothetical protein